MTISGEDKMRRLIHFPRMWILFLIFIPGSYIVSGVISDLTGTSRESCRTLLVPIGFVGPYILGHDKERNPLLGACAIYFGFVAIFYVINHLL